MPADDADSPFRARYRVVLNAKSGTTLAGHESAVAQEIRSGLASAGADVHIEAVRGKQIAQALERAAADPNATVVLAGGDGTISRALPALARTKRACGVLGLGTLNLFARDLGMTGTPGEQARKLAEGVPVAVDLATINGRPFHSISGFGYFGLMAREREQMREALPRARLLGFALAALRSAIRSHPFEVTMDLDGETATRTAYAIVVSNNRFDGTPWRRTTLTDGRLEVVMFGPRSWTDKIRMGWSILRGKWRDDPDVETAHALSVSIDLGRPRVSVSTDGELTRERNPIAYAVRPLSLSVIAARDGELALANRSG
ncbi:MAG: hypothetical protein BGP06_13880 [Rhizobiales bacterium 65-9]|nr:hypothetical protein [Hyphomicrobiales bacterium]OJY36775.1 MAG: hypothetical protein BGP06_13880 [Rhizobiales bacterium 65-9]